MDFSIDVGKFVASWLTLERRFYKLFGHGVHIIVQSVKRGIVNIQSRIVLYRVGLILSHEVFKHKEWYDVSGVNCSIFNFIKNMKIKLVHFHFKNWIFYIYFVIILYIITVP